MASTRCGVIGCGHFGRFHIDKYAKAEAADLVGVGDFDAAIAQAGAARAGVPWVTDHRALLGKVDAVSIVVPTRHHVAVARDFLNAGVHCLIEKPLAATVAEAAELVDLAARHKLVLQVGHLERFNPAVTAIRDLVRDPLFIESRRIAPFTPRSLDVSVVLDLMIHDLDLVALFAGDDVLRIEAVGSPVFSAHDDIVNARLRLASGCIVNVTAGRIGLATERTMRIFQRDAYHGIDFANRTAVTARKATGEIVAGTSPIASEEQSFPAHDALLLEIEAFLGAIRGERAVAVSGEDGLRALRLALRVEQATERPQPR